MTDNPENQTEQTSPKTRRINRGVTAVVAVIFAALIITLIVLFFVVTPYVVSGESMTPTLQDGDRIMVLKTGYEISRGDIILFERPGSEYPPVKRVIAVAGDTVMFNGVWVVNGEPLQEDYILEESYESDYISPYTCDSAEIFDALSTGLTLQEGQLFVLGDNRNNSYDSHKYGAISTEWVIGKVVNVY